MRLGRTGAIAMKEVMHILRDPQVLIFALGMPVLLLLLFGYAVSFDVERIPLVVVDQDRTTDSRELQEAFFASRLFVPAGEREAAEEAEPLLKRGVARAALIVPRGFARSGRRGADARAQLLLKQAGKL